MPLQSLPFFFAYHNMKMIENRLMWFEHVQRKSQELLVKRVDCMIQSSRYVGHFAPLSKMDKLFLKATLSCAGKTKYKKKKLSYFVQSLISSNSSLFTYLPRPCSPINSPHINQNQMQLKLSGSSPTQSQKTTYIVEVSNSNVQLDNSHAQPGWSNQMIQDNVEQWQLKSHLNVSSSVKGIEARRYWTANMVG